MRCALVRIDRVKLAWRLFRTMGHWPDEAELREWLRQAGFISLGGAWFSSEGDLAALHADEILETATAETAQGVTFIDRRSASPPGPDRRDPRGPNQSDPA
jgi:hypothetical protein